MWRASFSIPSETSLSLWKENCLSAPSTPPLFLLYTDITARTPQKSAHDVSSHFLVGRKKHNTSLAHEYCVPWQYIGFLMVDEIRLLYLTVPLRKVPRRNRTLASSTDVEKLSLKHGIHAPKVHFSSTSATQPKFSGRPPKWLVVLRDILISVALSTKTQIFTQNFKCFDGIYCSIAVLPLVPTRVSSTQMSCWDW